MELERLPHRLTVCKLTDAADFDPRLPFYFLSRTDEELSLVCRTGDTPAQTTARSDGWRGFRICGTLDFSLIGILARLTAVLAENGIGIFAVSTYNTDYILVREAQFDAAAQALAGAGYTVTE